MEPDAACSFCGKGTSEVGHLFVGPAVWICDGCVRVCNGILDDLEQSRPPAATSVMADTVMADIASAQQVALRGDREAARAAFARIWEQLGPDGDPLHRATLAHYTADVQDTAEDELDWDLRALVAADSAPGDHPSAAAIRGLYASLNLNVAAGFQKLGKIDDARQHLAKARAAEADLPAQGYGDLIRSEIAALGKRLDD